MTLLAAYDRAFAALAEAALQLSDAKTIGEVMDVKNGVEHIRLYARQLKDKELLAKAVEVELRTERRLGELLEAAKKAGQLVEGRRRKDDTERVTLDEIGIDRKLSSTAQKAAGLAVQAFEAVIEAALNRVRSRGAVVIENDVNGARAVMSSRLEADDSLDYFPTPPWATRALIERVFPVLNIHAPRYRAWEPACGEGHIAEVLSEYFADVLASDIHDYGYGQVADFLADEMPEAWDCSDYDWIITNPPFGDVGEAFVHKALDRAIEGIAMFMRVQWLDSIGRYERLFRDNPPTLIAFFAERVNLCKGRWDPAGGTATAYMWLIWKQRSRPRAPYWIAPDCRKSLSRPDDAERFTQHPVAKRIEEAA